MQFGKFLLPSTIVAIEEKKSNVLLLQPVGMMSKSGWFGDWRMSVLEWTPFQKYYYME